VGGVLRGLIEDARRIEEFHHYVLQMLCKKLLLAGDLSAQVKLYPLERSTGPKGLFGFLLVFELILVGP